MKREDAILLAGIAVGAVALPLGLGSLLGWADWIQVAIALVLLVGTVFTARWIGTRRQQDRLRAEKLQAAQPKAEKFGAEKFGVGKFGGDFRPGPAQPAEQTRPMPPVDGPPPDSQGEPVAGRHRVTGIPLPTAEAGYRFGFTATVWWHPAPAPVGIRHTNPAALAVAALLVRAGELTAGAAPQDHAVVAVQLAAALGTMLPDTSGQVVTWANEIELTMSPDDIRRLDSIAALRKDEQVWQQERVFERSLRDYLHREVLDTPGNAVVWWLSRHLDQVDDAVRLIGPLARLSAAANNEPVPESGREQSGPVPGRLDRAGDWSEPVREIEESLNIPHQLDR